MKFLIAMDSFKGSIDSIGAGRAVAQGIEQACDTATTLVYPVADGGEGTVRALTAGERGILLTAEVTGPDGGTTLAEYGILKDGSCVIEMAAAAGLALLPEEKRNPLYTTTFGVGELILHGYQRGCRNFIIGIGGSATNDGGIGMLRALGVSFLGEDGSEVPMGAIGLNQIRTIRTDDLFQDIRTCNFHIACDVTNPLFGENGCSMVYAPQKGADEKTCRQMDEWMKHFADCCKACFQDGDPNQPGAGAAGGLGYAFRTFLGASLEPGIAMILRETGVEAQLRECDYVFTGEGRIDSQTLCGKVPAGIAMLAKEYGIPVVALGGSVEAEAYESNLMGITAIFPIQKGMITLEEAMKPEVAAVNLRDTAGQITRLLCVKKGEKN